MDTEKQPKALADHIAQARKMVSAPVVLPEPVMAQVRYIASQSTKWSNCTVENADAMVGGAYEVRYLYTEQQVRELLAQATCHQAQPVKQEPVAWRYQTSTGWHVTTDASAALRVSKHHAIEPMYTAPQSQADALDAERLDWLIGEGNAVVHEGRAGFWIRWLDGEDCSQNEHQKGQFPTARDAIDAAIAAAKENK